MNILPKISVLAARTRTDLFIIPIFQDRKKKPILPSGQGGEWVKKLVQSECFTGDVKQIKLLRFGKLGNCEHTILVGLGAPPKGDQKSYEFNAWIDSVRRSGAVLYRWMKQEKLHKGLIDLDEFLKSLGKGSDRVAHTFFEGWTLAGYTFLRHKGGGQKKAKKTENFEIFLKTQKTAWKNGAADLNAISEAVTITRDWSNEPSNFGTPVYYANEAKKLAKKLGLKCKILTEADARREKMGLFLGVGQGSDNENRLVVLEYHPRIVAKSKKPKHVMLVGKGVTFDSGGISIKPSLKMEEMKHDMTGAATMMGAIALASRRKISNRVTAILAFAENMPSGNSIQPGNVLKSRSGKTVEVINTDAEGRLVLADAIDYAHKFNPDIIIDTATLTGAVGVALGRHCSALMTNDTSLGLLIESIGYENWERFWQLPIFPDYANDIKSQVADIRNSTNDRMAGTITAGMFLKEFIRDGVKWAHMDIAYTSFGVSHIPYYPKTGATGANVRSLARLAERYQ